MPRHNPLVNFWVHFLDPIFGGLWTCFLMGGSFIEVENVDEQMREHLQDDLLLLVFLFGSEGAARRI